MEICHVFYRNSLSATLELPNFLVVRNILDQTSLVCLPLVLSLTSPYQHQEQKQERFVSFNPLYFPLLSCLFLVAPPRQPRKSETSVGGCCRHHPPPTKAPLGPRMQELLCFALYWPKESLKRCCRRRYASHAVR